MQGEVGGVVQIHRRQSGVFHDWELVLTSRSNVGHLNGKNAIVHWPETVESDIYAPQSMSVCCLENDAACEIDVPVQRKQSVNI